MEGLELQAMRLEASWNRWMLTRSRPLWDNRRRLEAENNLIQMHEDNVSVCLHLLVFARACPHACHLWAPESTNKHIWASTPFSLAVTEKTIKVHSTNELSWLTVCCCCTLIAGSYCHNLKVTTQPSEQWPKVLRKHIVADSFHGCILASFKSICWN